MNISKRQKKKSELIKFRSNLEFMMKIVKDHFANIKNIDIRWHK